MAKVAIVDDVLTNALLIKGYMKDLPIEVVIFTDAREALTWCTRHDPDLILLDYMMPGMSGPQFLRSIRTDDRMKDIPVIVVTWDERKDSLYQALDSGASDYLRKPIDRVELLFRVQNMLQTRARQRNLVELLASASKANETAPFASEPMTAAAI